MNAKRGYFPEDERNFSPDAIKRMKNASRHIRYLINEGVVVSKFGLCA